MTIPSNCPLIEISGPARERGRQYGEQARDRIKRGVDHYATQIHASNVDWQQIREITARFEPSITAYDADYVEEMRGIAEGAGVEYAAILLLNARTEMLKLAKRRQRGEEIPDDPDGCTGLVALPAATKAGRLIHAQNWDWKIECAETAVVLRIRRENEPDILTFTEAGVLARFGFNSAGIAITGNYLECERDYRRLGVPLALIRRKVLEQRRLALAMHSVYTTPKSASNNIIVSHANGIAIDFECVPDETFQVQPENGLIVHANHFQSPVALSKLRDTGVANMPDSLYRDIRVRELLEPHVGSITPETVKAALFDDFETPWSVCRPPRENLSNNQSATVAMIVMEPATGTMEVALLPALNRQFASYSLGMKIEVPSTTVARSTEAARSAA
ncbi:C45 family peptidase [Bosea sp. BK604]|uniref:C45 family autoproteolytic acyltransferase/hydolase n=1 Tax=Bosea sp. BK604 TaxID=2512180 RepID=UPI0010499968|nr:C45 family peptidase [Bosea sp. BK604]TCR62506.1 isopenicillin-N N-acyltransferase-like protein [Bosea sp. BK604]